MGDVFPELIQHEMRIREIIAEEEASFGKTLLKVTMSVIYWWLHYFYIDNFLLFTMIYDVDSLGASWLNFSLQFKLFHIAKLKYMSF